MHTHREQKHEEEGRAEKALATGFGSYEENTQGEKEQD